MREFENQIKAIKHDPEGKRKILEEYVQKNPNASLRQISRDTGMSTTTVRRIKEKFDMQ
ncbi:AsnC family protein [Bacillus velezensis]|nr:AsnC family protein [Bacillus velezensis]